MTFKEMKKREVYRTWINKNRRTGIHSYVHMTTRNIANKDSEFYHFEVMCRSKNLFYSSLDDRKIYSSFDECVSALEECLKNI